MKILTDVLDGAADYSEHTEQRVLTAFVNKDKYSVIPYEHIRYVALRLASALKECGVEKGSYVIFQIIDIPRYVYSFWACQYLGAVPVPLPVMNKKGDEIESIVKLKNIYEILSHSFILCENENIELCKNIVGQKEDRILHSNVLIRKANHYKPYSERNVTEEDIAMIQFSSGSTSTPKGVILRHKNIIKNMEQINERLELEGTQNCASWMPLTHDMGMIAFHLMPLKYYSNSSLFQPDLFLRNPLNFLKHVAETKAEFVGFTNSILELYLKLANPLVLKGLDLSHLRCILNGAEPINCASADKFMEVFGAYGLPKKSMCFCYGMAEASLVIAITAVNETDRVMLDTKELVYGKINCKSGELSAVPQVGRPMIDLDVVILSKDGETKKEDIIGEICIKGENVTEGYINTEGTALFTNTGYLRTGDKGFLHEGRLAVTGRIKDIIFKNGANYYSHDLERIVYSVIPELQGRCAVAQICKQGKEEKLALFLLTTEEKTILELKKKINGEMLKRLGFSFEAYVLTDEFPRTSSGKIQRFMLVKAFEEENYKDMGGYYV